LELDLNKITVKIPWESWDDLWEINSLGIYVCNPTEIADIQETSPKNKRWLAIVIITSEWQI
jgi:hypothetical protein